MPITTILENAFYNSNIESVVIGDNVTTIGKNTFMSDLTDSSDPFTTKSSLKSVVIGRNVTTIEECAFKNTKITDLVIPGSLKTLGRDCFMECNYLENVIIEEGVKSLGRGTFWGCGLTTIVWPKSLTNIDHYRAFRFNSNVTHVFYGGTKDDWDTLKPGDSTFYGSNINDESIRYYYSETKPTTSGKYWHYENSKPVVWEE